MFSIKQELNKGEFHVFIKKNFDFIVFHNWRQKVTLSSDQSVEVISNFLINLLIKESFLLSVWHVYIWLE